MNLLDRHIFTSVLLTCATAVGLFAFVVALPNILRELLGPLLAGQFGLETFVRLVALLFPFAISFALPMGILTGVLLTLGRLSADSEITAMRAAGISIARISLPVFVLGAVGAATAFYVNFESMPWARVQYHREFAAAVRANPLRIIVPKTFIRDFSHRVLYVGQKDGPVLRDIWLWELDDQSRVRRLVRAEAGRLDYDEATNSLIPTLVRVKVEERDPENPEDFSKSPKAPSIEKTEEVRISLDNYFGRNLDKMKQDWLTYDELRTEQARMAALPPPPPEKAKERALERMKLDLIVQDKFNLSLAVFSFALLGVPLGIKISRRETSANLGLALVLVLSYYLLTVMVKWLDRHPEYRPDLLLGLPNLIFIGLGLWLFTRIDRK
ncbi:MAG: YjgP/YjgQ family permease [Opitutus sp.]|nr:YjgP/YjgQ family permease [Opitutus sp.]